MSTAYSPLTVIQNTKTSFWPHWTESPWDCVHGLVEAKAKTNSDSYSILFCILY